MFDVLASEALVLHLQSYTSATISTTIRLEYELSQIAKQGFALDLEEFHDDMIAIAVPIYDNKKQVKSVYI